MLLVVGSMPLPFGCSTSLYQALTASLSAGLSGLPGGRDLFPNQTNRKIGLSAKSSVQQSTVRERLNQGELSSKS